MFFLYRGRRINYSDSGNGSAIILLHGYLESSGVWNGFEKNLVSGFRVISVDLPGHGLSDMFSECHTMEFMAEIIKKLIDSLGIEKVFLTGHSLGGYVTLAFLELFPETLSGYCLFHSHPFPDTPETVEKRKKEIALVAEGKKDLMYPDNITRMFAASNLELCSEAYQRSKVIASRIPENGIISVLNGMMIRPSRLSVMEEGRVPCLWILGALDSYIQYDMIISKVKLPANARVEILKNSGHIGFIEETEKALIVIKKFMSDYLKN